MDVFLLLGKDKSIPDYKEMLFIGQLFIQYIKISLNKGMFVTSDFFLNP
jgi:hypothetical protein